MAFAIFAAVEFVTGTQPMLTVDDNPSSMSPTLNYGDVALIYRAPFSSLGVGSIIAFHDPRGDPIVIMHRIVALGSCGGYRCFMTKGDNNATNPTVDPWNVSSSDYVGEVVLIIPYAGYVSPALWGFNGTNILFPVSTVGLAVVVICMVGNGRIKGKKGGEE